MPQCYHLYMAHKQLLNIIKDENTQKLFEVSYMLKIDEPKRLFRVEKQVNVLKTTSLKNSNVLALQIYIYISEEEQTNKGFKED